MTRMPTAPRHPLTSGPILSNGIVSQPGSNSPLVSGLTLADTVLSLLRYTSGLSSGMCSCTPPHVFGRRGSIFKK